MKYLKGKKKGKFCERLQNGQWRAKYGFAKKRQWEKVENFTAFFKSKGWIDRVMSLPNLMKFLVVALGGDGYGVVQYSFIYFYDSRRRNNVPDWLLKKIKS